MNRPSAELTGDDPVCAGRSGPLDAWLLAVTRHADRPSLLCGDGRWATFSELDAVSGAIAQSLRRASVAPGSIVTIRAPRGPFWPAAILGAWKADCGYFASVADDMSADARTMARIGSNTVLQPGQSGDWRDHPQIAREPARDTGAATGAGSRHAYVMATSGTTGSPKLAFVSRQTGLNVLEGLVSSVAIRPGETALQLASFGFSSSVRQVFVPLFSGSRLVIVPDGDNKSGHAIVNAIAAVGVTHLDMTPSQIRHVLGTLALEGSGAIDRTINRLLVASEVLSPELARHCRDAIPGLDAIIHMYGKTEIGGSVSVRPLAACDFQAGALPLSEPFAPFGSAFARTDDGDTELLIGGLTRDDLVLTENGIEQTGQVRPFAGPGLWHATGDHVRLGSEGEFHVVGRRDRVAKVLGKRIDLSDLEALLRAQLGTDMVVADLGKRGDGGAVVQVTYVAQDSGEPVDDVLVLAASQACAPGFPMAVRCVGSLPVDSSGKVDRRSLRAMSETADADRTLPNGDRCAVLDSVWRARTNSGHAGPIPEEADFFRSGGDSLSTIGFLSDVSNLLGVQIPLVQFLADPTLGSVRKYFDGYADWPRVDGAGEFVGLSGRQHFQPTHFQRALSLSEKIRYPYGSPYWLDIEFRTDVPLDPERLETAVARVLREHDILRLGFVETDDLELRLAPDTIDPARFRLRTATDPRETPIVPLANGPHATQLFQMELRQDKSCASYVRLMVHHGLVDRRSLSLLLEEIAARYSAPQSEPDAEPMASDLERLLGLLANTAPPDANDARAFWTQLLPGPVTVARRRTPNRYERLPAMTLALPHSALPAGATAHAVWLSAFVRALGLAGLPHAGIVGVDADFRDSGSAKVVGPMSHALPIALPNHENLADLARHATTVLLQAVPFARHPVPQVMPSGFRITHDPLQPLHLYKMVFQRDPLPTIAFAAHPAFCVRSPDGIPEHDFTLHVRADGETYTVDAAYDANVVSEPIAAGILSQVRQLIETTQR